MVLRALVVLAVVPFLAAAAPGAVTPSASSGARILYAGDWTGSMQIFAADPSGRTPVRQVTFARPVESCYSPTACGFTRPLPSPDGRRIAYWDERGPGSEPGTLWVARADGTGVQALGPAGDAAWASDSRRLSYTSPDGVHVLTWSNGRRTSSIVSKASGDHVRWSPDGKALAFIDGRGVIVLRARHERVLAHPAHQPSSIAWTPDGREVAYGNQDGVYFVSTATGRVRTMYRPKASQPFWFTVDLAFAPNGRRLAFTFENSVHILDLRTRRVRDLRAFGHGIDWSPDGTSILFVPAAMSTEGDSITTDGVKTVTLTGRIRTVVSPVQAYGGQIVAAAWTRAPRDVHYRAPQKVDGVFAGGPVQEIAADGSRVAFIACGGVSVWSPDTESVAEVARAPDCRASFSRGHVYALGIAGDRIAWVEKGWGLCFQWTAHEATIGGPTLDLGAGSGCLGSAPIEGLGTAVGAGSLLVMSAWTRHLGEGGPVVDAQSIRRVGPGGCPCPMLSTSPGLYEPLDVDASRIVVSGENETRILDGSGVILRSLPLPTSAAQVSGDDVVIALAGVLRDYDARTGALRASWPLPAQSVGHDCDVYGDPVCEQPAALTLGDVAHGLAAYVVGGQVHVLRLANGRDTVVGPGTLARFADAGLVFADGARIRLIPYATLS